MSISNSDVEKLILAHVPDIVETKVNGDGYKYEAIVVSPVFEGMNTLKKHQTVYGGVKDVITSGELHALTIRAYTPSEWESMNNE